MRFMMAWKWVWDDLKILVSRNLKNRDFIY